MKIGNGHERAIELFTMEEGCDPFPATDAEILAQPCVVAALSTALEDGARLGYLGCAAAMEDTAKTTNHLGIRTVLFGLAAATRLRAGE